MSSLLAYIVITYSPARFLGTDMITFSSSFFFSSCPSSEPSRPLADPGDPFLPAAPLPRWMSPLQLGRDPRPVVGSSSRLITWHLLRRPKSGVWSYGQYQGQNRPARPRGRHALDWRVPSHVPVLPARYSPCQQVSACRVTLARSTL